MRDTYHFVGIGGDGMSGLAKVFWQQCRPLHGSNIEANRRTFELSRLGVPVALGHAPEHLGRAGTVVYSSAIPPDNVELREARRRGLVLRHRQDVLAELANARRTVGVAGTHGKTTAAAMTALLLRRAGRDPAYLLGAGCPGLNGHAAWGQDPELVLEVDESDGHFLKLRPALAVITNVGLDHLSYYRDQEDILENFARFASQAGRVILCADDPQARRLLARFPQALSYGLDGNADLVATGIRQRDFRTEFVLRFRGKRLGRARLNVPGVHNVQNALAALLAGYALGLRLEALLPHLEALRLPERRFEVLAKNGIMIVDDYAHLPEQIAVNLRAARSNWRRGRLIALFQPHRFSRTRALGPAFGPAFAEADLVGITEVYPAFEPPLPGVDAAGIVRAVSRHAPAVRHLKDERAIARFLHEHVRPGDFVIGFGAGDLWRPLQRFARRPDRPH